MNFYNFSTEVDSVLSPIKDDEEKIGKLSNGANEMTRFINETRMRIAEINIAADLIMRDLVSMNTDITNDDISEKLIRNVKSYKSLMPHNRATTSIIKRMIKITAMSFEKRSKMKKSVSDKLLTRFKNQHQLHIAKFGQPWEKLYWGSLSEFDQRKLYDIATANDITSVKNSYELYISPKSKKNVTRNNNNNNDNNKK